MDGYREKEHHSQEEELPLVDAFNALAMTGLVDSVVPGVEHSMPSIDPQEEGSTTTLLSLRV